MTHQPLVERFEAQPYLGIRCATDNEPAFRAAVDDAFPELYRWLADHEVAPTGPPLIRYLVLSDDGEPRDFEVGVPIAEPMIGNGRVQPGALPAGAYATVLHVGPYRHDTAPDLADARAALLEWVGRERLALDCWELDRGTAYRGCVERYLTDPSSEPDWSKWRTEIAYLALAP